MAAQSIKQDASQGFHKSVTGPILGSIAAGAFNSTPRKQNVVKPAVSSRGKASAIEPPSAEIEIEAKLPLIEAITALGGPEVLLAATDLELVVSKFPKGDKKTPSNENRFVQGLQGRVISVAGRSINNPKTKSQIPVKLSKGDMFRIRWDFVPGEAGIGEEDRKKGALAKDVVVGKGLHINAEFGIGASDEAKNKIAFMPDGVGQPVVDAPTARNAVRFDQIVKDQSTFLGYDTKPNTLKKVFTVAERLHPASSPYPEKPDNPKPQENERESTAAPADITKIAAAAARKLAERWANMFKQGTDDVTTDPIKETKKAHEVQSKHTAGGTITTALPGQTHSQGSVAGAPTSGIARRTKGPDH